MRLGILRHVDDFPTLVGKPFALRLRAKARALYHHHSPFLVDVDIVRANYFGGYSSQFGVVSGGRAHVRNNWPVKKCVSARICSIHELVAQNEIARLDMALQTARCART